MQKRSLFLHPRFSLPLIVAVACGLSPNAAFAQKGEARADHITAGQMRNYLTFLSDDVFEGRDTPSRGLDTAARFFALNLERWGYKPAGDNGTFFQNIALTRDSIAPGQASLTLAGKKFAAGDDFIAAPVSGTVSAPMVYVGSGWRILSKGIDPYKGMDVKGKIVVAEMRTPFNVPGVTMEEIGAMKEGEFEDAPTAAKNQGAAAIVQIVPDGPNWTMVKRRFSRSQMRPTRLSGRTPSAIPTIYLRGGAMQSLFDGESSSGDAVLQAIEAKKPLLSFALSPGKTLDIRVNAARDTANTQNVVAIWEGEDPILKNEYVVLSAHYDHLGKRDVPAGEDGIYNGADDDGSGTTALLAMAEALPQAKRRPKRSLLFIWHCGEEKGLWGSEYFTRFPAVPLKSIVTDLNIDMIGRSHLSGDSEPATSDLTGPNDIYVIGPKVASKELGAIVARVNSKYLRLNLSDRYDATDDPNRYYYRSDHYNYARNGIPVAFFFDGTHVDYHRVTDTADKIDYGKMERVTRTIYQIAWELGDSPTRPKQDAEN